MIAIDRFLSDEQDPKAVEKVISKLNDILAGGEEILYLAVQKKPAVNLLPDCIAITNKRIFYCTPGNLGLTMNFKDLSWKQIKEVSFKEEFFGSKFICVPLRGENIVTEYIPKTQARKLYQAAYELVEEYKEVLRQQDLESKRVTVAPVAVSTPTPPVVEEVIAPPVAPTPVPPPPVHEPEDEFTQRLKKLKILFEKQLITQDEYEAKKADILSQM